MKKRFFALVLAAVMIFASIAVFNASAEGYVLFSDDFSSENESNWHWDSSLAQVEDGKLEGWAEAVVHQTDFLSEDRVFNECAFKVECAGLDDGGNDGEYHDLGIWITDYIYEDGEEFSWDDQDRIVYVLSYSFERKFVGLYARFQGKGEEYMPDEFDHYIPLGKLDGAHILCSLTIPESDAAEIDQTGQSAFTLGMKVTDGVISCYYNDKKAFEFLAYRGAASFTEHPSPIGLFNKECRFTFDNFIVTTADYTLFNEDEPWSGWYRYNDKPDAPPSADAIYFSDDFSSKNEYNWIWEFGFNINDGKLEGRPSERVFQTNFSTENNGNKRFGECAFKVTAAGLDDGGEDADEHFLALWWADYINPSGYVDVDEDGRLVYTFGYKFETHSIYFNCDFEGEGELYKPADLDDSAPLIEIELPLSEAPVMDPDGRGDFTLGMRIKDGVISCFLNDKKYVDFNAYRGALTGRQVGSPIILWNGNCHCTFDDFIVMPADQNLFNEPQVVAGGGDANGDGSINARDVILTMKAALAESIGSEPPEDFIKDAADTDFNYTINARDVIGVMKKALESAVGN